MSLPDWVNRVPARTGRSVRICADTLSMPVMPPVDPVLLEILRSEVGQYLQTIRAAILRAGTELRVGEELLRAVHTLHGAIAMVDIALLMQVLSPLEGLLKRLRAADVPLSSEGIRLLGEAPGEDETAQPAGRRQTPLPDRVRDEAHASPPTPTASFAMGSFRIILAHPDPAGRRYFFLTTRWPRRFCW